jgi:hypothetical protein
MKTEYPVVLQDKKNSVSFCSDDFTFFTAVLATCFTQQTHQTRKILNYDFFLKLFWNNLKKKSEILLKFYHFYPFYFVKFHF